MAGRGLGRKSCRGGPSFQSARHHLSLPVPFGPSRHAHPPPFLPSSASASPGPWQPGQETVNGSSFNPQVGAAGQSSSFAPLNSQQAPQQQQQQQQAGTAAAGQAPPSAGSSKEAEAGAQQQPGTTNGANPDEPPSLSTGNFHLMPIHIILFSLIFVGGAGACWCAVA
eukprot:1148423-Pelagomonas_calceolata.AAC.6